MKNILVHTFKKETLDKLANNIKMIQQNKELLLKDLCCRLPYGVKLHIDSIESPVTFTAYKIDYGIIFDGMINIPVDKCKPYLFPMSAMTEEQKEEFEDLFGNLIAIDIDNVLSGFKYALDYIRLFEILDIIDWLNKYHFDYRNLIEKGLAIDATDLNIY